MKTIEAEVLVIGGGATGAGVLRDVCMRGYEGLLAERSDLAMGTSGRFHGLLHSGGRYAVKDPSSAKECMDENRVLRRIAADCIEDTSGYFVTTEKDDPSYSDLFIDGCKKVGIPVEEVSVSAALAAEPRLSPRISRVLQVPDAAVDAWKTVWACVRSAEDHGGRALPYHKVTGILREGDRVVGAVAEDRSGDEVRIRASFTINASGAWAASIAALAGCGGFTILPGRGIMIAMAHRLVDTVINRCQMPTDGDILVPIRTVSVIGTTDEEATDPDDLTIHKDEVDQMLEDGETLVPGFKQARALRVGPGYGRCSKTRKPKRPARDVSRSHRLLDHHDRDGVEGFITITGGKFTTFRRMAEDTVDAMGAQLEDERACNTHEEALPDSEERTYYTLSSRLSAREEALHDEQIICECELIGRRARERYEAPGLFRSRRHTANAAARDGTLPGGFCIYRSAGILHSLQSIDADTATSSLRDFLQERWKGLHPILYGDGLRQAKLDDWIFQGLLDVEHLQS